VRVTELVPQVAERPRFRIRAIQMTRIAASGLDHATQNGEMRGAWFVKSSNQRINRS
jgi:hypothetical protein